MPRPAVIAHRGASYLAPEETEPAYVLASRTGPIIPILEKAPTFVDTNLVTGGHDLRVAWYRPDAANVSWLPARSPSIPMPPGRSSPERAARSFQAGARPSSWI